MRGRPRKRGANFLKMVAFLERATFLSSRFRLRCSASARRGRWRSLGTRRSADAPSATGACTLTSTSGSSRTKTAPWS